MKVEASEHGIPEWAVDLRKALKGGASGQFVLYGNIQDSIPFEGSFVRIEEFIKDDLLRPFDIVFEYDLGNGLRIDRGHELVTAWIPSAHKELPREPLDAFRYLCRYRRWRSNSAEVGDVRHHVAILVRGADRLVSAGGKGFEHGGLTSLIQDLGVATFGSRSIFATFLISDNLNDLEPQIAFGSLCTHVKVPLPSSKVIRQAVAIMRREFPAAFPDNSDLDLVASAMAGVSINTLYQLTKARAQRGEILQSTDFSALKKEIVERDAPGLVEFIETTATLDDYYGQEMLKASLRQDIALWRSNDLMAMPMGYLVCGPVGVGKTFLMMCFAGEAGVPVLKLRNFRDMWIGSSEGNLEKILRLIRAIGRCVVFVDEADQTLGRRESGPGDGGLSGRIYSMLAQEMSNTDNRGKVLWVLASSRPDLIEVDLKRPGRIDMRVPLLPVSTRHESRMLVQLLSRRFKLEVTSDELQEMEQKFPERLIQSAAEALVSRAYRLQQSGRIRGADALRQTLASYLPPVRAEILEEQIRLAIREASDSSFVPEAYRHYIVEDTAESQAFLSDSTVETADQKRTIHLHDLPAHSK